MKKPFYCLFVLFLSTSLFACSSSSATESSTKSSSADSSSETASTEVSENPSSTNENAEPEKGSYEAFEKNFLSMIEEDKNTVFNDSTTQGVITDLETYFPNFYNLDVKTFNSEDPANDWFFGLLYDFSYLRYYYDEGTVGDAIGETGLRAIYCVMTGDETGFSSKVEELRQKGEENGLTMSTKVLSGRVDEGQYKVGSDIPSGEYALFTSSGSGYFCVSSDANSNDIIYNDNFPTNTFITVYDGEYLTLNRAYAVPVDGNEIEIDKDNAYMLRVGVDLPAGEYKLSGDQGYYCIYSNSRQEDIIANDNFSGQAYINVSDGQYLVLSRCSISE